jgi:hypothetical protein
MKKFLLKKIIPILHLSIIITILLSPWFIPWKYIILIFILFLLQLLIFKGCILTQLQFGNKNEGFYYHYLKKIFPSIKQNFIENIVRFVIPFVIIAMALLIQVL